MGVPFAVPLAQEKAAVPGSSARSRYNAIGGTLALAFHRREQFREYRNARQGGRCEAFRRLASRVAMSCAFNRPRCVRRTGIETATSRGRYACREAGEQVEVEPRSADSFDPGVSLGVHSVLLPRHDRGSVPFPQPTAPAAQLQQSATMPQPVILFLANPSPSDGCRGRG
jgi:hypothetical protein